MCEPQISRWLYVTVWVLILAGSAAFWWAVGMVLAGWLLT